MSRRVIVLLAIATLFIGGTAYADEGGILAKLRVGPEAGVFLPSSGRAQDRFGDAWFSVGVGIGGIEDPDSRGKVSPDFDLFYQTHGSNHAFFLPVGASYRQALGRSGRLEPYAGAGLYGVLTDLRSDQDGVQSRYRPAYAASLFAGLQYGRHGLLEVRYYAITRVRSLDLSGLNVKVGYRF